MPPVPVSRKHMEGNVEFKDVSYTADDEDIVKDISFSVKKDRQSAFSRFHRCRQIHHHEPAGPCRFVDATSASFW